MKNQSKRPKNWELKKRMTHIYQKHYFEFSVYTVSK
jgi:hypothetical protein